MGKSASKVQNDDVKNKDYQSEEDKKHPDNEKCSSKDFKTPVEASRGCKDILCIAIFAVALAGYFYLVSKAVELGDLKKIYAGIQYDGELCGVDVNVKNKKYLQYPMAGLPQFDNLASAKLPDLSKALGGFTAGVPNMNYAVCVEKCPADGFGSTTFASQSSNLSQWKEGEALVCIQDKNTTKQTCWLTYKTIAFIGGYCFPDIKQAKNLTALANMESGQTNGINAIKTAIAGWQKIYDIVLISVAVILIAGIVQLCLLRIPFLAGCLVTVMIFLIIALLGAGGQFSQAKLVDTYKVNPKCNLTNTPPFDEIKCFNSENWLYFILLCLAAFFLLIYILFVLCSCKRIRLATAIIKVSAKAMVNLSGLMFVPFLQFIAASIATGIFVVFAMFTLSAGKVETISVPKAPAGIARTFTLNSELRQSLLGQMFVFFWVGAFIVAIGQMINALAVSIWFFTRAEKRGSLKCVTCKAFYWCFRYHLGTLLFGSCIIAICKIIQAILMQIQKQCQASGNKVAAIILTCLTCCMKCVEKFLKFLNKNAYIQCAIQGQNFCTGARKAFFLIIRNFGRLMTLAVISTFIATLGRILVTLSGAATCQLLILYVDKSFATDYKLSEVKNQYILIGLLVVVGYLFGFIFVTTFEMTVSTIMQCFIADEEMTGGEFQEPYSPEGLAALIDTK